MTPVFRPILKTSLSTLLHAPSIILFGVVIALFGMLRQPFMAAGWPNLLTRLATERWLTQTDVSNALSASATFSWKALFSNVFTIARTDPWGASGFTIVFGSALAVFLILLYLLPRAIAALIETGHIVQTKERYTAQRAWRLGRRTWLAITCFLLIAQLVPWAFAMVMPGYDVTTFVITLLVVMLGVYASCYRVIGDYTIWESLRSGVTRLIHRLGTTIECTVLMVVTDIVGLAILSVIGAIALVPFLLLLIIFWTLQWSMIFSWFLTLLFILLALYTLISFATIIAFDYLVWINLFYTYEVVERTSFTARSFSILRSWIKKRSHHD